MTIGEIVHKLTADISTNPADKEALVSAFTRGYLFCKRLNEEELRLFIEGDGPLGTLPGLDNLIPSPPPPPAGRVIKEGHQPPLPPPNRLRNTQ